MMRIQLKSRWKLLAVVALCFAAVSHTPAADDVAGPLIVFNDNGAWSWFEDERAIVDVAQGKILVSSVANGSGAGGAARHGDVEVVSHDPATGQSQRFTLSDALEADDHNSAALLRLPDGRYLASYSKHSSDNKLRYRISTRPGDITAWHPEKTFLTAGGTTYSNLHYLSKSNAIFNFHRDKGRGLDPNYLLWKLGKDAAFSYGGRLLTGPEGNAGSADRPYLKYASNAVDRIDFITTDGHPRNQRANGVYHGYIQHERGDVYGVFRSDGTRLGALSRAETSPYKASDFTTLLAGDAVSPNGLPMTRGWTTDIALDHDGHPYAVFTARVEDNDTDHRFIYARFVGDGWRMHELAKAGGYLYPRENDYTGLAALDPHDPNRLFISTTIDPRTVRESAHYEIFVGHTADGGATWTWSPITANSTSDNLRPIVPRGDSDQTALLWMRGTYTRFTDYNMSIVGLTDVARPASNSRFLDPVKARN